jgi:integrase
MSLYKQAGSEVWWADITVHGHPRLRRSTRETDRIQAQRVHDELKAGLWKADPALKGKTWGKAVAKWVAAEERSDSELLSLAKFGNRYKDRLLTAMTPESIDTALSFCETAGTHTRYCTMIAAILNMSDVKLKLIRRRDKKSKAREWITHDQWERLYAELPKHMKPMAKFAVLTGLRQANVLGLEWSRVDLDRKVAWVEAEDMKADEAIAIPLSKDAHAVLTSVQGQHPQFVFTFRGKPIQEIKTAFRAACIRAATQGDGVPGSVRVLDEKLAAFTWHGLRHTWATWHIQNGTPLEVLKELGGWSDLRMVMHYAHHSPSHLASFADNTSKKI